MATTPRVTIPRSYEDFQPPSNLWQEEDCETLIVDLPGFRKEQVRVQMEDRSRTLLITGERPIGNNKWSRFRKDLRVPINCNTSEVQAKFENGVLRVIMPLKVVPKTAPPPPSQKFPPTKKPIPTPPPPPPPPSQKTSTESKPTSKPQIPGTPNPVWDPLLTSQFPATHNQTTGPKPLPSPLSPPSKTPITESRPVPSTQTTPSQKLVTEPKPPPRPEPRTSGRLRPKPAPQGPQPDSKTIPLQQDPPKQSPTQDPLNKTQTSESTHLPTAKSTLSQLLGENSKSDMGQDNTTDKKIGPADHVEKTIDLKTDKPENAEKQEREKEPTGAQEIKAHIKENVGHVVEDYKGRSKRPAMERDDSGQYVLNMVAAVLVVIALWFYTKYTVKTFW